MKFSLVFFSDTLTPENNQRNLRPYCEVPWDTLLTGSPIVDPVIRSLVDEGGYPFPKWLWDLCLGLYFFQVEICFSSVSSNLSCSLQRPAALSRRCFSRLFSVVFSSLGLEARLQQKLAFTCVCQHIDLMVYCSLWY